MDVAHVHRQGAARTGRGGARRRLQPRAEFALAHTLLLTNCKQTLIYLLIFQSSPVHGADWSGLMAAATLTSLPVVVPFVLFQSRISVGLTAGAVKG